MGKPAVRMGGPYTYHDYLNWHDEERWELIDGIAYDMTPAPSRKHQEILGELYRQFSNYLLGKDCKVYPAPFDVRLPKEEENVDQTTTVVQPDITVVCDPPKLDERGCNGAPDLVIEILSPETAKKDLTTKLMLYERVGVKEYWVVHPVDKTVMIFEQNQEGEYGKPKTFGEGDQIPVRIFLGLTIDLTSELWT